MNLKAVLASIWMLLLASCVNLGEPDGSPPVPGAIPTMIARAEMVSTPAHNFLTENVAVAKSVVLFTAKNEKRKKWLCDAYNQLVDLDYVKEYYPTAEPVPTYWLSTKPLGRNATCADKLANYDYNQAALLMARFGLAKSKGPVLLVMDGAGQWAFLDLSDASKSQVKETTTSWLSTMAQNKMTSVTYDDEDFFERIVDVAKQVTCGAANKAIAKYEGDKFEPASVDTYLTDDLKLKDINVYQVGAFLLGGPITSLVCAAAAAA